MESIRNKLPEIILTLCVVTYSIYFSLFTINRNEKLYSHYFDLGIMHQTVYNTYQSVKTADFSRFLELTDPHGTTGQVKRMSIHNDMLLAAFAPFYFIHDGPETLLVIQSISLAMGAVYLFLIAKKLLKEIPYSAGISVILSVSYLLYPPLENANRFEFHAVTIATMLLLGMYYYWLEKKYVRSFICIILSLLSKEQVGMTTALFGGYILFEQYKHVTLHVPRSYAFIHKGYKSFLKTFKTDAQMRFAVITIAVSMFWILISMYAIIPATRGEDHFAAKYYDHLKERPWTVLTYPFKASNMSYFNATFGPVGYISFFSPLHLLIVLPEFGINLLSSNPNMRNTYFHYNSIITPFIYISAVYALAFIYKFLSQMVKRFKRNQIALVLGSYILVWALLYSYLQGPFFYSVKKDLYPWLPPGEKYYDVMLWEKILKGDQIKVASTGNLAAHFTSRQFFYDFGWKYDNAEYLVIDTHDVQYGYLHEKSSPSYSQLQSDRKYIKLYSEDGIEVYRRITN